MFLLLTLAACGKDKGTDTDTAAPVGCDLPSEPLGAVAASEWPPDLGPTLATYDGLGGRWTAQTDCGIGEIGIKLVPSPRDDLQVVSEQYDPLLTCGCIDDPQFGPDGDFTVLATFDDFEFYIETWDDPGVESRTVLSAGAIFDTAAPFAIRLCGRSTIDPYLDSEWDNVTANLRVVGGQLEATVVLTSDAGGLETCNLSDFEFVVGL